MADRTVWQSSTTAPVNIAVIKYWGKRDPVLNLPTNSSLSVTLSQDNLRTHTTASCSERFTSPDTLLLNGSPQDISTPRPVACIRELRTLRATLEAADPSIPKLSHLPLRIVSENNFPTAAGLASSAAGFAAFVRAIADLYKLPATPAELSRIARQGSGSACRSLFGGYVAWRCGEKDDGSDSVAEEVAPLSHWPDMRALILVASASKKDVSSTAGMQTTVKTSTLFPSRAKTIVPQRMLEMELAIREKNFEAFGLVTMRDSNSFHATCLDTDPPIFYMNDVSRAAIRVVESINQVAGKVVAAYTFDAGPNAVIYFLEDNRDIVAGVFKGALENLEGWDVMDDNSQPESVEGIDTKSLAVLKEGISRVIYTKVGDGPRKTTESLIDQHGEPIRKT